MITDTITVTIAEVEVNDEYRVTLRTRRKLTDLSPDDAMKLSDELAEAALDAARKVRADFPQPTPDMWSGAAHGFDVVPRCRECAEGKHGACNGTALVDEGDTVREAPCACDVARHRVIGAES